MTVKEFWNSKEYLAIHCDTEEKANKLLKKFDELGKKWSNETSYLKYTNWYLFSKDMCYDNEGDYCDKEFYENEEKIEVIEFNDLEDFREE